MGLPCTCVLNLIQLPALGRMSRGTFPRDSVLSGTTMSIEYA